MGQTDVALMFCFFSERSQVHSKASDFMRRKNTILHSQILGSHRSSLPLLLESHWQAERHKHSSFLHDRPVQGSPPPEQGAVCV